MIKIYKTMITVVLHGCQTRSHTLREEYGLRMFKNTVMGKIIGTKREEVTRNWKMRSFAICLLNI
jgi:hypothetical protein